MAPVSTQRLVPIRPSPLKGVSTSKTITVITPVSVTSSTMSVNPSAKRKLCGDSINSKTKKVNTGNGPQVTTMGKRNARERNRVKQVNNSFLTLRQHIPGASKAKKISKVDTLKKAVDYIKHLSQILEDHENSLVVIKSQPSSVNFINKPVNSELSNTYTQQHSQYTSQAQHISKTSIESKVLSDQPSLVYPSYYYNENISPVSAVDYPMNVEQSTQQNIFKSESDYKSDADLSFNLNPGMTPTYSDVSAPVTPVSQGSFILPHSQSSPYSINTAIYQPSMTEPQSAAAAHSPNSMAASYPTKTVTNSPTPVVSQHSPCSAAMYPNAYDNSHDTHIMHSPNSSAMYSPNSLPPSPTSSPSATSKSNFNSGFQDVYKANNDPSFIKTRDFIIPPAELQYCLSPIISIDIDKATATTKDDLDLLEAIHFWQQN